MTQKLVNYSRYNWGRWNHVQFGNVGIFIVVNFMPRYKIFLQMNAVQELAYITCKYTYFKALMVLSSNWWKAKLHVIFLY